MLSLTHASAGALAGTVITNPVLAFVSGVIIHLLMDKVPHYWPREDEKRGVVIFLDALFSGLYILGLYLVPEVPVFSVVAGALGGVSVDFYFVLVMRSKGKWAQWHTKRQIHKTEIYWYLSDAVLFFLFTGLLWTQL